jgi:GNAT superfamily N-acetyltransferase
MSTINVVVRSATEADLEDVAAMVHDFVVGHPAEHHPRPLSRLREAYFGTRPVAHLLVATRHGRVVGMLQWSRIYDMFWSMFGADIEWLYVRPEARGLGISAALIAEACRQVRLAGGELLRGGAEEAKNSSLYERVAAGWPSRVCYLSAEAFQVCADLAGLPARDIVRRLPAPELNRVPARPR